MKDTNENTDPLLIPASRLGKEVRNENQMHSHPRHPRFGGSFSLTTASGQRKVAHSSLASIQNVRDALDASKKSKNPKILKNVIQFPIFFSKQFFT